MTTQCRQESSEAAPGQSAAPRVLVTGFGRYPGVRDNPTANLMRHVVARLNRRHSGPSAQGGELTVSYARAPLQLTALMAQYRPDAILLLGLAPRARWVRIERYARQLDSPLHPDSTGRSGALHASVSDLPLRATGGIEPALQAVLRHGIRARLSPSAGRYLCNAVYASALALAAGRPVLFVHVPYPRGCRGGKPALSSQAWQPDAVRLETALVEMAEGLARQARRTTMRQTTLA